MSLQSLVRRRPSASLAISCVALFVSLGGVGAAAVFMAPNSVGSRQLRNGSVSNPKIRNLAVNFNKIAFGTVGIRRINTDQVQARVNGTCANGAHGAIGAIDNGGRVTCNSTLPTQLGMGSGSLPIGTSSTAVGSKALPGGSNYLVIANPYAAIAGSTAGQRVAVTCTLAADGASESRTAAVEVGASKHALETAIPIVMPAPSTASGGTATVSCAQASTPSSPRPTVTAQTTIDALQVATNG